MVVDMVVVVIRKVVENNLVGMVVVDRAVVVVNKVVVVVGIDSGWNYIAEDTNYMEELAVVDRHSWVVVFVHTELVVEDMLEDYKMEEN